MSKFGGRFNNFDNFNPENFRLPPHNFKRLDPHLTEQVGELIAAHREWAYQAKQNWAEVIKTPQVERLDGHIDNFVTGFFRDYQRTDLSGSNKFNLLYDPEVTENHFTALVCVNSTDLRYLFADEFVRSCAVKSPVLVQINGIFVPHDFDQEQDRFVISDATPCFTKDAFEEVIDRSRGLLIRMPFSLIENIRGQIADQNRLWTKGNVQVTDGICLDKERRHYIFSSALTCGGKENVMLPGRHYWEVNLNRTERGNIEIDLSPASYDESKRLFSEISQTN